MEKQSKNAFQLLGRNISFQKLKLIWKKSIFIKKNLLLSTSMGEKKGLAGLDISSAFIQTPSTEHLILHASTIATLQYSWKVV